jgi:hypothetical protein
LFLAKQLRQLGDIDRNPSRLILAEQLGGRSPARLILEIDIGERLPGGVANGVGLLVFLDGPRRREAAFRHRRLHATV